MKPVHPKTGEEFVPHLYKDGRYRIADPAIGKNRHHAANQIAVDGLAELKAYVRRGFSVRMRGLESGQVNLVSADQIDVSG